MRDNEQNPRCKLTLPEQETVITFARSSDTARIYTADPVMMRRLDTLSRENGALAKVKTDEYSRTYICPKACGKVQKPRIYTDAEREKRALRMKARIHGGEAGA